MLLLEHKHTRAIKVRVFEFLYRFALYIKTSDQRYYGLANWVINNASIDFVLDVMMNQDDMLPIVLGILELSFNSEFDQLATLYWSNDVLDALLKTAAHWAAKDHDWSSATLQLLSKKRSGLLKEDLAKKVFHPDRATASVIWYEIV